MAQRPNYVEYAFSATRVIGKDTRYIRQFAKRWGGLSLASFAQALREGDKHEQQVAVFALGYTESAWARDLLLPLLASQYSEVRWAAAISLGQQRVETAFSVLIDMLQEFLPPHPPITNNWFDIEHIHIAHIFGSWGKRDAIAPLHQTLVRLWQSELLRSAKEDGTVWWYYQDALVYALGQLEAFDLLATLDIPQKRKRFWQVTAIMGYLNAERLFHKNPVQIVQAAFNSEELTAFLALVVTLLHEHMAMSPTEADFAVRNYDSDYFVRWEQGVRIQL